CPVRPRRVRSAAARVEGTRASISGRARRRSVHRRQWHHRRGESGELIESVRRWTSHQELEPGEIDYLSVFFSSLNRNARASAQSRLTVATETLRASAVSSRVS